jgi:hypothetical protein
MEIKLDKTHVRTFEGETNNYIVIKRPTNSFGSRPAYEVFAKIGDGKAVILTAKDAAKDCGAVADADETTYQLWDQLFKV